MKSLCSEFIPELYYDRGTSVDRAVAMVTLFPKVTYFQLICYVKDCI